MQALKQSVGVVVLVVGGYACASLVACSGPAEEFDAAGAGRSGVSQADELGGGAEAIGATAELEQELVGITTGYWTGSPPMIPVCWINPNDSAVAQLDGGGTVPESTLRLWVREGIEGSWARFGRVNFTGWGTCPAWNPATNNAIRLSIKNSGGSYTCVGKPGCVASQQGGVWNIYYDSEPPPAGSPWCRSSTDNLRKCVRSMAIHEMGHALGFGHGEEQPNYAGATGPGGCTNLADLVWPPWRTYGSYDYDSIMSTCAQGFADPLTDKQQLSRNDIAALQTAYGRRVAGQVVNAQARCLSNNNVPNDKSFIWDCDEAAGQIWTRNWAEKSFKVATNGVTWALDSIPLVPWTRTDTSAYVSNQEHYWPTANIKLRGYGGMCLELVNGSTANYTHVRATDCCDSGSCDTWQRWTIASDQTIRYGDHTSTKCLTMWTNNGDPAAILDCGGYANQKFAFATDGSIKMYHTQTKCLDVPAVTTSAYLAGWGGPVPAETGTWDCISHQINQKWNISGSIKKEGQNLCLDVLWAGIGNGSHVQVYSCNTTIAQQWDYYWK